MDDGVPPDAKKSLPLEFRIGICPNSSPNFNQQLPGYDCVSCARDICNYTIRQKGEESELNDCPKYPWIFGKSELADELRTLERMGVAKELKKTIRGLLHQLDPNLKKYPITTP